MVRQNLSIYEVDQTESQNGKTYWKVKTNKGFYSVWDEDVAQDLQDNQGTICDLEIEIKGKYKNITAFNGGGYGDSEPEIQQTRPAAKPTKTSYELFEERKQKHIDQQGIIKLKSISVAYALQKYNAEIGALIGKAKDLKEAQELIIVTKPQIAEEAKGFYNIIRELDKIPEPKKPEPRKTRDIIPQNGEDEPDYSGIEEEHISY